MKSKLLSYDGEEIKVTYDLKRCIHAAECVNGLPSVFNPDKKPWIDPDEAAPGAVADVIETCPTGALKYELKSSKRVEQSPSKNRISIQKDGPVYIYGDIEVIGPENSTLLEDTRVALCRCGAANNKPLCDNTHVEIDFKAGADADVSKLSEPDSEEHEKLILKLMKDGPVLVEGTYTLEYGNNETHTSDKNMALCRCGASGNKPFCDGSHKPAGFKSA